MSSIIHPSFQKPSSRITTPSTPGILDIDSSYDESLQQHLSPGLPIKRLIYQFNGELDEDNITKHVHLATPKSYERQLFDASQLPKLNPTKTDFKMDDFKYIVHLCSGPNSTIYEANTKLGNYDKVILKVLKESSATNDAAIKEFQTESLLLSTMSHPNIVNIVGSGFVKSQKFHELMRPLIVLEHLNGGTLAYHLSLNHSEKTRPFTECRYLRMAKEFACALDYMHNKLDPECTLIHRDLKPDNIGFTKDGTLKLMDFGLSVCVRKGEDHDGVYKLTGYTGSLRYMAPEVALSMPYNEKVDIYGFGIILYQIVTGVTPYRKLKLNTFHENVVTANVRPDLNYDDYGKEVKASEELKQLMASCWDADASNRPSASSAYQILLVLEDLNSPRSKLNRKNLLSRSVDRFKSLFAKADTI